MKHIAVILAAGSGRRMGTETPKQFLMLSGKPVLAHSLDAFEQNAHICQILVVTHPDYMEHTKCIVRDGGWKKVCHVIAGGAERTDSSLAAIRAVSKQASAEGDEAYTLLLHDAARPFVSQDIISRVCTALETASAVNVCISSSDTILQTDAEGLRMTSVPPRNMLRRVQTPQGFRLEVIAEAYRRAMADTDFQATDDCSIVLRYMPEVDICLVEGEEANLKLTNRDDLSLLDPNTSLKGMTPLEAYRARMLRPLQLKMLEMLKVIADILDRNGVRWWLQGGTLLGAVRHGGFIPWDDDMDIDVLKEDVPRMVEALRRELPPQYELPDPPRRTPIYKVRLSDSFFVEYADDFSLPYSKGVFIDIFPQGPAPTVSRGFARIVAQGYCKANSILGRQHYYSLRSFAEFFWFGARRAIFGCLWKLACLLRPSDRYLAQDLQNNGLGLIHERNRIFPLSKVRFEDTEFPAPADPDFYLREDFGDYMQLPPEAQRHGHAVFYVPSLNALH